MTVLTDVDHAFIGAFLSTLLYGAYLVVSYQCFQLFYYRYKARSRNHKYLVATHIILFILINIRCIATFTRCIVSLVNQQADGTIVLGDPNSAQSLLVNITWILIITVSDMFIIYRAYIVTRKRLLVVAVPTLLLLADMGVGIWLSWALASSGGGQLFALKQITTSLKLFCSLTLAINISSSGLIAWEIYKVRRNVTGFALNNQDTLLSGLVVTIIESAALWTAITLCIVITTLLGSFVNYILIDLCPPIVGLVFVNIITRVSRGQSYGDTNTNTNSGTRRTDWSARPAEATETNVQIRLDRIVHTHQEDDFEPSKISGREIVAAQDTTSVEAPSVYGSKG